MNKYRYAYTSISLEEHQYSSYNFDAKKNYDRRYVLLKTHYSSKIREARQNLSLCVLAVGRDGYLL